MKNQPYVPVETPKEMKTNADAETIEIINKVVNHIQIDKFCQKVGISKFKLIGITKSRIAKPFEIEKIKKEWNEYVTLNTSGPTNSEGDE